MDFGNPLHVVTPTLDAAVLRVLAGTTTGLTGREISRMSGSQSHEGTRRALERLVTQGIVLRVSVGRAHSYRLNREHLAAPHVEGLAALRLELVARLRERIGGWRRKPLLVALFGSAARGDADPLSDIDLLVVRPTKVDSDADEWRDQLLDLEATTAAWTGNDTRVLEYSEAEVRSDARKNPVIRDVLSDGIELYGSLALLRRALRPQAKT